MEGFLGTFSPKKGNLLVLKLKSTLLSKIVVVAVLLGKDWSRS